MNKTNLVFRIVLPLILTIAVASILGYFAVRNMQINDEKNSPLKSFWRDFVYPTYRLQFSLPPNFLLESIDDSNRFPIRMSSKEMQIKLRMLNAMGTLVIPKEEIPMLMSLLEIDFQKYLQGYGAIASNYSFSEYQLLNRKAVLVSSQIDLKEKDKNGRVMRPIVPSDLPKEWAVNRGSTYFINHLFILWEQDILVVQVSSPAQLTQDQYNVLNQILLKLQVSNLQNNAQSQDQLDPQKQQEQNPDGHPESDEALEDEAIQ